MSKLKESIKNPKFFYRDTDVPADLDFYTRGRLVRAGEFLEASDKLLRPVHRTRFFIAARRLASVKTFETFSGGSEPAPFREYLIFPNTYFMVTEVQRHAGVTQIVLLNIPRWAVGVAAKSKGEVNLETCIDASSLNADALNDLKVKMGGYVHGNSLSDYWNEAMRRPIGMDKDMKPYDLYAKGLYGGDDGPKWKFFQYCMKG